VQAIDGRTPRVTTPGIAQITPEGNALRGALDALPVGIALFDAQGRPTVVNRAARDILGPLAESDLESWGKTVPFTTHTGRPIPEEEIPPLLTLQDGQARRDVELVLRPPTGPARDILLSSEAVLDPTDHVQMITVSVTALDQVRKGEALAHRAARTEAVAAIAHNLAGPFNDVMTALCGYLNLALERLSPSHPVHAIVTEARASSRQAALLANRLTAFGAQEIPAPKITRLDRWLSENEMPLRRLAGDHIKLQPVFGTDAVTVSVDPRLLEQIVTNLVANARDAMEHGGTLMVEAKETEIDPALAPLLGAAHPGRYGVLVIADTVGGMEQRVLPKVFEPFFSTKKGALGLGLATADRLVRLQGGFLRVENRHGQGSAFHVHLPIVEVPEEAEGAEAPPPNALERHLRVLVVEDDVMLRGLLRAVLESEGMEVVEAPTADAAAHLAEASRERIDLLISDVILPGESGDILAARLKARDPHLRVLLMSGCSDVARLATLLGEGTPFLPKPFSPDALRACLRDLFHPVAA